MLLSARFEPSGLGGDLDRPARNSGLSVSARPAISGWNFVYLHYCMRRKLGSGEGANLSNSSSDRRGRDLRPMGGIQNQPPGMILWRRLRCEEVQKEQKYDERRCKNRANHEPPYQAGSLSIAHFPGRQLGVPGRRDALVGEAL
jgi:hypothetical protein